MTLAGGRSGESVRRSAQARAALISAPISAPTSWPGTTVIAANCPGARSPASGPTPIASGSRRSCCSRPPSRRSCPISRALPRAGRACARSRRRRSRTCSSCGPGSAITRAHGICTPAPRQWSSAMADTFHRAKRRSLRCPASAPIRRRRSRRSHSTRRLRRSTATWSGWWRGSTPSPPSCRRPRQRFGASPRASCRPNAPAISRKR